MSLLASWLASPPPDAAVEIAPTHVSAASMGPRGSRAVLNACAIEPLPEGAVTAALTASNVLDRAAAVRALRAVLDRLDTRPRRVALNIPDLAAKVSVLRFDHVPARRDDLEQLVRWQVRKTAPFPVDDACVALTPGAADAAGAAEFVVVLARRDIVAEYEGVCAEAGLHPGLVDIASFSVVNLALGSLEPQPGDWLIVHVRPEYTSIAIVRDGALIFFRSRPEGTEESLADLVHQTSMYYQDRLAGQGFARVLLGGSGRTGDAIDEARRSLEDRLGTPVEALDRAAAAALGDRAATLRARDVLAPLAGILLRTRRSMVHA